MAKTAEPNPTDEFEGIDLTEYDPETVEGVYDRHVRAMLAADEALAADKPDLYAKGKRTKVKILTANDDKAKAKTIREFQDSARAHDRTGKKVGEEPQGSDGQIALSFILVPKQSRPRTKKNADATPDTAPETETAETVEPGEPGQPETEDAVAA